MFIFRLVWWVIRCFWRWLWRLFWLAFVLLLILILSLFFMTGAFESGWDGLVQSVAAVERTVVRIVQQQDFSIQGFQIGNDLPLTDTDGDTQSGTRWNEAQASIYISPDLDERIRAAYVTAIENWNQTGVFHFTVVDNEDEADIVATQIEDSTTSAAGDAQSQTNLLTNRFTSVTVRLNTYYLLNPVYGYSTDRIIHTAEHELGHAIGLEHNEGQSVMQSAGSYLGIQPTDIEAVRSLYATSSN